MGYFTEALNFFNIPPSVHTPPQRCQNFLLVTNKITWTCFGLDIQKAVLLFPLISFSPASLQMIRNQYNNYFGAFN